MLSMSDLIFSAKSLIKSMNKSGELGSHCLRPISELKNCESEDLYLMQDLTTQYMDDKALTNLIFKCSEISFCHNRVLSVLSNRRRHSRDCHRHVFVIIE